ncbi:hypothetical protein [Vallitalea guaymasensis]|uniref:hypothetical protein n=1 Tax=Vallitalea guaymasensis TaxID=1185412 RepID=UPI000DE54196|nr:hypothetical protein [Vallitalea guaymasensis]
MKEIDKKVVILARKNNAICIRIERLTDIGGKLYTSIRHEMWANEEKYKNNIISDEHGFYMRGISGSTDSDVIKIFNQWVKD